MDHAFNPRSLHCHSDNDLSSSSSVEPVPLNLSRGREVSQEHRIGSHFLTSISFTMRQVIQQPLEPLYNPAWSRATNPDEPGTKEHRHEAGNVHANERQKPGHHRRLAAATSGAIR